MWQDTVIAICQFLFVGSMIPTIRGDDKPALFTSLSSAIIVSVITFSLITLEMWLTAISAAMIMVAWSILAFQKYRIDRAEKAEELQVDP